MTTIREEMSSVMTGMSSSPYPSIALQAKILTFAVEHEIDQEVHSAFAERAALLVIAARYFRMVEDDRWATWMAEQDA